ncbi:MAG: chromosome partitioning protein ParB, partial [Marinobacter sp.]|nr:chromosome partitioning protein ParB [Marinobacter sp.]
MAAKKRGLGERGLGALLQGSKVDLDQKTTSHDGELREIPIDLIQ